MCRPRKEATKKSRLKPRIEGRKEKKGKHDRRDQGKNIFEVEEGAGVVISINGRLVVGEL